MKDQLIVKDSEWAQPVVPKKASDSLIYLRGALLMMTTINLFVNVYIMMSLDRFMIAYALFAMLASVAGQLAAIVGQFGYSMGRYLAFLYAFSAVSLSLVTYLDGRIGDNLLLNLSLAMTAVSGLISGFVAIRS